MAIAYGEVKVVSAAGPSVVGLSAYVSRSSMSDHVSGASYSFTHRADDLKADGVIVPKDAPEWASDPEQLWNRALLSEMTRDRKTKELRYKDGAQVAKSYIVALPKELDDAGRLALAQDYLAKKFGHTRVAVQWAIHDDSSGTGNHHLHIVHSTRPLTVEGFSKKKDRSLNPDFSWSAALKRGRPVGENVGQEWSDFQNQWFEDRGLELRVDPTAAISEGHRGPTWRMPDTELERRNAERAEENQAAARDQTRVVEHLIRRSATFTEWELWRFLEKAELPAEEIDRVAGEVLSRDDLVRLESERRLDDGYVARSERFTTRAILDQERGVLSAADRLSEKFEHGVSDGARSSAIVGRTLDDEQAAAFEAATRDDGFAMIRGRAGTGKSYTMGAIRAAYEADGYRVVGLAPTNTVAADLRQDGFLEGRTVASELLRQEHEREVWDRRTVVMVDEMAMLSTRDLDRLLGHAAETGAKVVGVGDDRQLASVERGGLFTVLADRREAAELSVVRRQKEDWQREASQAAARGEFDAAITAYDDAGAVKWTEDRDASRSALVERFREVAAKEPEAAPFVYSSTNDEVDRLNRELRAVRVGLGQIDEAGRTFTTAKGDRRQETTVSVGDRVQFTKTEKDRRAGLDLRNGEFGTVRKLEGDRMTVELDGGRRVAFDARERNNWSLGYAGTVYKGQGKTQRAVMAFYDNPATWRANTSYVALTRHASSFEMFVSRDLAGNRAALSRQMSRDGSQKAAITFRELPPREQVPEPTRGARLREREDWEERDHASIGDISQLTLANRFEAGREVSGDARGLQGEGREGEAPRSTLERDPREDLRDDIRAHYEDDFRQRVGIGERELTAAERDHFDGMIAKRIGRPNWTQDSAHDLRHLRDEVRYDAPTLEEHHPFVPAKRDWRAEYQAARQTPAQGQEVDTRAAYEASRAETDDDRARRLEEERKRQEREKPTRAPDWGRGPGF